MHFPAVLHEETIEVGTSILAEVGGNTGTGIESRLFGDRGVVEEVPIVQERIGWTGVPGRVIDEKKAGYFAAQLQVVAAINLGQNVLKTVGPLIKRARSPDSKALQGRVADYRVAVEAVAEINRRQSPRGVRVERQILPAPARG